MKVRLLDIDCHFTDHYLIGHARRVGLAGTHASDAAISKLLPTIRADVKFDSERLRDMNLAGFFTLRQGASREDNAASLAAFLDIPAGHAREIAETDYLFVD